MGFFQWMRRTSAGARIEEEFLYQKVAEELRGGMRREGLWAKALADSSGDESRANSLYLKYRVQSLRDEIELSQASTERGRGSRVQARIAKAVLILEKAKCKVEGDERSGWLIEKINDSVEGRHWIAKNIKELEAFARAANE